MFCLACKALRANCPSVLRIAGKIIRPAIATTRNPTTPGADCLSGDWCGEHGPTAEVQYSEGIFLGYRYCASPAVNTANVQPRFPFGFGLSYTTFAFGNLALNCTTAHADDPIEVTLTVRNTGRVAGAEVAQIYVSEQNPKVPRPRTERKAFQKVRLGSAESRMITLPLDRRSFAYWSEHDYAWTVDPDKFTIYAGDSSASRPLHADLTVTAV